MRLQVDIGTERAKKLISYAIARGYRRSSKRLEWSTADEREAVQYGLNALLDNHV